MHDEKFTLPENESVLLEKEIQVKFSEYFKFSAVLKVTNFHLLLDPKKEQHITSEDYLSVGLPVLLKVAYNKNEAMVYTKDFRFLRLVFRLSSDLTTFKQLIPTITPPYRLKHYPAYNKESSFTLLDSDFSMQKVLSTMLKSQSSPEQSDGNNLETDQEQEENKPNKGKDKFTLSRINEAYALCETYPSSLAFPSISGHTLRNAASFRSKARLPALCYLHSSGGTLFRCAQPNSGFSQERSTGDEELIHRIRMSVPSKSLTIFDCRPFLNALGNRLIGKGYENSSHYSTASKEESMEEGVRLTFLEIANIHEMRRSLFGLMDFAFSDLPGYRSINPSFSSKLASFSPISTISSYLSSGAPSSKSRSNPGASPATEAPDNGEARGAISCLASSNWLRHISKIISGASLVARAIDEGEAAVVRCSDGWDRTAQICSLATILLQPSKRTVRGLCEIVSQEWVSFGHKFSERNFCSFIRPESSSSISNTDKKNKEDQFSPIFFQFLDALREVTRQFPQAFEFDEKLLRKFFYGSYSGEYSEFLASCEKEFREEVDGKATSLIEEVTRESAKYVNPFYRKDVFKECLYPCYSEKKLGVWKEVVLNYADFSAINGNDQNYLVQVNYESFLEKKLSLKKKQNK